MIYLLHGTDIIKSRKKLHLLLDSIFEKKPDASYIRIEVGDFDKSMIYEFLGGQGLFENKYIVVFDNLFEDKNTKEILLKKIKDISESKNIFIFLEKKLNKTELSKFEKYAEKVQEFKDLDIDIKKEKKFDIFSLTDAFGRRNKKELWVLYQKAKLNNVSDEEIHGILFWQIKSMLLTIRAASASESGLNPFVYRKSLGFVKNYSNDELKAYAKSLMYLYHDTRRGIHEMDSAMEMFILGV